MRSDKEKDAFDQTNADLAKLLHLTSRLSDLSHDTHHLQDKARAQMDKIVADAEHLGGPFIQEVKAMQSALSSYLQHPSEAMRVKIMQEAMNLKHKMREL